MVIKDIDLESRVRMMLKGWREYYKINPMQHCIAYSGLKMWFAQFANLSDVAISSQTSHILNPCSVNTLDNYVP